MTKHTETFSHFIFCLVTIGDTESAIDVQPLLQQVTLDRIAILYAVQ